MQIKGTVAVVTGAASGIGRAFCVALLKHGAKTVVMLDVNVEEGQKLQAELASQHGVGAALFKQCDVTNKVEFSSVIIQAVADHGRLDILCNNAGISDGINKGTAAGIANNFKWEKCIETNFNAVIYGTYIGIENMKSGVIVNTSSLTAFFPFGMAPVYAATKAGIVAFTRSVAMKSLEKGVRVNCICPGLVDTPFGLSVLHGAAVPAQINEHEIVQPEFIAKGLIEIIEDDTKNGQAMRANAAAGIDYMEFIECAP